MRKWRRREWFLEVSGVAGTTIAAFDAQECDDFYTRRQDGTS